MRGDSKGGREAGGRQAVRNDMRVQVDLLLGNVWVNDKLGGAKSGERDAVVVPNFHLKYLGP